LGAYLTLAKKLEPVQRKTVTRRREMPSVRRASVMPKDLKPECFT
jgi:hypothetical protein